MCNRPECLTANDARREKWNNRDRYGVKDRRDAEQQRLFETREATHEFAGREDLLNSSQIHGGNEASQDRIDDAPELKNHQIDNVGACERAQAECWQQRENDWADHVQNSAVEAVEKAKRNVGQRVNQITDDDKNGSNQTGEPTGHQIKERAIAELIKVIPQIRQPYFEYICAAGHVVCNEIRERAKHSVDVPEDCGVNQENKAEANVLHCGHAEHPNIPATDEGFVDGDEE